MTKDWRLQHLETQPYLRGVSFVRKPYRAPRLDGNTIIASRVGQN